MSITYLCQKYHFKKVALLCIGTFILLATLRFMLLMAAGSSVPFWDQWGGENAIFSAFQNGSLTWQQLFSAHNEHRIFWTRLLTIILFNMNGQQWDNQLEAVVSSGIYCAALTIPVFFAAQALNRFKAIAMTLAMILAGALPFGWENTLVGFQSQFYINSLLAFLAIGACAYTNFRGPVCILPLVIIGASMLAMANGVLTAFCCAGVLSLRSFTDAGIRIRAAILAVLMCLVGVIGYGLTPSPAYHAILKAQNIGEWISALWITSSWPMPPAIGQVLLIAPVLIWLVQTGRQQKSTSDLFFLGLNILGLLNSVAISYSRGHDLAEVTSRYTDTILPTSMAACYFAIRLATTNSVFGYRRSLYRFLVCLAYFVVIGSLIMQSAAQLPKLRERAYFLRMSTLNTAYFLAGEDSAFQNKPHAHVPYPDPIRLAQSLRAKDQTNTLPTSVLGAWALSGHQLPLIPGRCSVGASKADNYSKVEVDCSDVGAAPFTGQAIVMPTGALSARLMQVRQALDISIFPSGHMINQPKVSERECALDSLNERSTSIQPLTAMDQTPIRLSGWASPSLIGVGPMDFPSLKIALVGKDKAFEFDTGYSRTSRPDVVIALKNSHYERSGFDAIINASKLPAETYRVFVSGKSKAYCDTGHNIILTKSSIPFATF
ncbi:hypothetical protein [Xanthomonas prunicola]|nr:hypothetical protein [Xanthomonas prunicola]